MSDDARKHSTGLERFSHLEDKIFRTVEEIRAVRKDNETLRNENSKLKEQIEVMSKSETETLEMLAQFEKEREELKNRVEKTLELLASLESQ